eukprot:SAG31_NODE_2023_length_6645_cov_15.211121_6_plen_60_part_00
MLGTTSYVLRNDFMPRRDPAIYFKNNIYLRGTVCGAAACAVQLYLVRTYWIDRRLPMLT